MVKLRNNLKEIFSIVYLVPFGFKFGSDHHRRGKYIFAPWSSSPSGPPPYARPIFEFHRKQSGEPFSLDVGKPTVPILPD